MRIAEGNPSILNRWQGLASELVEGPNEEGPGTRITQQNNELSGATVGLGYNRTLKSPICVATSDKRGSRPRRNKRKRNGASKEKNGATHSNSEPVRRRGEENNFTKEENAFRPHPLNKTKEEEEKVKKEIHKTPTTT